MSPLTKDRFEALADAYGGEVARWPARERDAATLLMATEPGFAQGVLARAGSLDAALDDWRPTPASPTLREAILAAAPMARRRGPFANLLWKAGLGAGLAAACAAGLIVGVGLSAEPQGTDAVTSVMTSYDAAAVEEVG